MNRVQIYETLPAQEREDFQRCCEHYNYNRKEFEVEASAGQVDGWPVRTITVTRNGYFRNYHAGDGTDWLVQFDDDLRAQRFGDK
jgi:hypothetical protein